MAIPRWNFYTVFHNGNNLKLKRNIFRCWTIVFKVSLLTIPKIKGVVNSDGLVDNDDLTILIAIF